MFGHFSFSFFPLPPPPPCSRAHVMRHPTAGSDLFLLLETLGQGHLNLFLAVFVRLKDHYLPFNAKHRKSVSIIFGLAKLYSVSGDLYFLEPRITRQFSKIRQKTK